MQRAELMLQIAGRANCRKFVQPADVVAVRARVRAFLWVDVLLRETLS